MSNFKFITKDDIAKELFFKLPKALMYEAKYKNLSANAKLLYSMLLDRAALSIENNWFDSQDRAYIICEVDEVEIFLNCARGTANKSLKELEKHNLIMKFQQGQGKANLLYVAHVDTSKDTLDTHLKFHKRMLNALKAKRKEQKEKYESKKFKNCTPVENTKVDDSKFMNTANSNRSTKNKSLRVQNLDGNNTNNKETDFVVVESNPSDKVSLVKKYGFDVTDIQVKLIEGMDFNMLKDAVETTVAKGGKVFGYIYEVYKSLRDNVNTKPKNTVDKTVACNTTKTNYSKNKNTFDNFEQSFMQYEEDELYDIIIKSQEVKFGKALCCR